MNEIQIGSITLPGGLIVLAIATAIGLFIGKRMSGSFATMVENKLWQTFWIGIVTARISFVLEYKEAYFSSPLDIVDIRDGGWHAFAGFGAACLYGLIQTTRLRSIRKPLGSALLASLSIWLGGSFLLSMQDTRDAQLSDTPVVTLQGQKTALSTFAGKPTVVNLWASWCPPCVREMPVLDIAQQQHPELHFVFLNQSESADTVQKFLRERDLVLDNVLFDPQGAIAREYQAAGLPTTLFFDASGRLIDKRMGELSRATLADRLSVLQNPSRKKPAP